MKKIFFFLVLTSFLFGCDDKGEYSSKEFPEEKARLQAEEIIDYIKENDKDAIYSSFSEEVSSSCDLYSEISFFLENIDGKIDSVGSIEGREGEKSTRNGKISKRATEGIACDIKTENGCIYDIYILSYDIFEDSNSRIGICYMELKEKDENNEYVEKATIGFPLR